MESMVDLMRFLTTWLCWNVLRV